MLIVSSVLSVLAGRPIDRLGKLRCLIPAGIVGFAGLVLMYFARSQWFVLAAGIVMLGGGMVISACCNGLIRDYTPAGKAGLFQGIRIVFQVLLPMVTGPYIGAAVIRGTGMTYEDLGTIKQVPTSGNFPGGCRRPGAAGDPGGAAEAEGGCEMTALYTPWGEQLDRSCPLPEYPRPQLRRDSYLCLNGLWDYTVEDGDEYSRRRSGKILVPFSPESLLSGCDFRLQSGETLWYERTFTLPEGFRRDRVLLHFGAVDQCCRVLVNDRPVGGHEGGYLPFTLDITGALVPGENRLTVAVTDDPEGGVHAFGKQRTDRGGIWYTAQSGIWQTVWLESTADNYVRSLRLTPDFDGKCLRYAVRAEDPAGARVTVLCGGRVVARSWADERGEGVCPIPAEHFRPWSPEDPYLYDLEVTLPSATG